MNHVNDVSDKFTWDSRLSTGAASTSVTYVEFLAAWATQLVCIARGFANEQTRYSVKSHATHRQRTDRAYK